MTIHDREPTFCTSTPSLPNYEIHPADLVLPFTSKFIPASWMDDAVVTSTAHCLVAMRQLRCGAQAATRFCAAQATCRSCCSSQKFTTSSTTSSTGDRCIGTRTGRSPSSRRATPPLSASQSSATRTRPREDKECRGKPCTGRGKSLELCQLRAARVC